MAVAKMGNNFAGIVRHFGQGSWRNRKFLWLGFRFPCIGNRSAAFGNVCCAIVENVVTRSIDYSKLVKDVQKLGLLFSRDISRDRNLLYVRGALVSFSSRENDLGDFRAYPDIAHKHLP